MIATIGKPEFTTKDTKSTKFKCTDIQTFVAFVRFVVREYSVISKCRQNINTV